MSKVSVLMPAYNAEEYIEEAIKSIINQTYKDFELIIVDDGSTDNTIEIIKKIRDKRIKVFENKGNKGLPYTRERLLSLARGKYIALMDADDISLKNRLKKQVEFLENNMDVDVVGTNFIRFNEKKIKIGSVETNTKKLKYRLIFMNGILNSSAMFRKEFIDNNRITYRSNFKVAQDYAFWIDCSANGVIANLNSILVKYREGHNNITKKSKIKHNDIRKKLLAEIRKDALRINNIQISNIDIDNLNYVLYDNIYKVTENDLKIFYRVLKKISVQKDDDYFSNVIQYVWRKAIEKSDLSKYKKISLIFKNRFYRIELQDLKFLIKFVVK